MEEQKARSQYEHKQATNSFHLWKTQLLRKVVQGEAKQDILGNLDKESTLMIIYDYGLGNEISGNEIP